jgi:tetratricopeptide (TPR) repeat protein
MQPLEKTQRYMIILLIFILIALSGPTPHAHEFKKNLLEANRLISYGAHLQASKSIATALQQQPWQISLWEEAGHYALKGNDPQTAIDYLESVAHEANSPIFPSQQNLSVKGLADLGQAYKMNGDLDAAFETWQKAESQYGASRELFQHKVSAYLSQGDFQSAISELQRQIELQPEDADLEYQLGLLLATQNPESALPYLERAAELNPEMNSTIDMIRQSIRSARYADDPVYSLMSSGRALAAINQWELSAEAFRQAILAKPNYAEAWAYLGEARQHLETDLASKENSQDGFSEIQTALELDPESLSAHSFLALYWERQDRYDLALDAMQQAADLDPNNALLHSELARIKAASGDLEDAYDSYLKAVELAPNDPTYQRKLVNFSLTYDFQTEEIALPIARRLVISDDQNPLNLDLMGQVLINQGDLNNAERFLERALKFDPDYGPAHLHMGLIYVLKSNYENAYEELNLAISLSSGPDDPTAKHARRLLNSYFP